MRLYRYPLCLAGLCLALLAGCATPRVPQPQPAEPPAGWLAPRLPHQGSAERLADWWARFDDPLLSAWILRAQQLSPSVAAARAQVLGARAALSGARQQGRPQLDGVLSASRAFTDPTTPTATVLGAGVQASWALALWGEDDARVAAAQSQQEAAGADWHAARVLVAAELAQVYFGWHVCQAQRAVAQADSASRQRTAETTGVTEKAGFTAPAVAALARASAAESRGRVVAVGAACERHIKALTALTGLPENGLRAQLDAAPRRALPLDGLLAVPGVPADVLRQRPDVFRAQRQWVAAAQEVGLAQAALLPGLSLSGHLTLNRVRAVGVSATVDTWSLGPLALRLPLLGRERLQREVDAAEARYEAAGVAYAATVRQAVSEVEQVLVSLAALAERAQAAEVAVAGYRRALAGTESRWGAGLASLQELEDARRVLLAAENADLELRRERLGAWLQLYVALGGGFEPTQAGADALTTLSRDLP